MYAIILDLLQKAGHFKNVKVAYNISFA